MTSLPWIALTGRKRSGKDTVASILVEGYGYTRVGFADPLKEMALAINPFVPTHAGPTHTSVVGSPLAQLVSLYGWERAKEYPEVRRLLQVIGTEAVRNILGEDTWADAAEARAQDVGGPVVFTDCRFPNEARMVARNGGLVVRVNRPGLPNDDLHPSETAMDDYPADFTIPNDGALEDLEVAVAILMGLVELSMPPI